MKLTELLNDVEFRRAMYLLETAWSTVRFQIDEGKRKVYARACLLAGAKSGNDVRAAVERLIGVGKYPPSASEVAQSLSRGEDVPSTLVGVSENRPDLSRRAMNMVRLHLTKGVPVCRCVPRDPNLLIDRNGVITCPTCKGIDAGQADTALELQPGDR